METNSISPEKIAQIKELLKEMDINPNNESIIQDNKIVFPFKDKIYRTRMPNQKEQSLAEQAQNKFKVRLFQEDDTITRKRLIKTLKEKQDIDISEFEKNQEKLKNDLRDVYLDLVTVDSKDIDLIEELRAKKLVIESKFMEISIEIIELLSPCIEEQIKSEYYKYLSYLCTEKQIKEDIFESVWENYDKFGLDDTGLTYQAIEKLQSLLLSIRE